MGTIRHRAARNFNLDTFTDELHNSVGASAFVLSELLDNDPDGNQGHDYFTQEDLVIRTASGGGGVLLVQDTDYSLSEQSSYLSNEATSYAGATKNVYKKIQVTNAAYQAVDLYFSGKYIADDLNPVDVNNITNYCLSLSTDTTISNSVGYVTYLVTTTDTAKTTVTLPDATKNKNLILKILKVSDTYAPVVIDTFSTQTINGWSYTIDGTTYELVPIFFANECVELISDGSNWKIINGYKPVYDMGIVYHPGSSTDAGGQRITLTGISGSFELFEVIEGGTSGQLAIVCEIDSGNSYLWILQSSPEDKTSGNTGSFQAETITGGTSGANGTYSAYNVTATDLLYPFPNLNGYDIAASTYYNKKPIDFDFEISNSWTQIKENSVFNDISAMLSDFGGSNIFAGQSLYYSKNNNGYLEIMITLNTTGGGLAMNLATPSFGNTGSGDFWYRLIVKG